MGRKPKTNVETNNNILGEQVNAAVLDDLADFEKPYIPDEAIHFEQKYFDDLKLNGIDVTTKGAWQKMYAYFIDTIFGIKGKSVIDLGGACGSIASAFADYGTTKSQSVDISEYAISKSQFKNITNVCAPIWQMKEIPDNSIDFVHAMFSFNYIPSNKIYLSLHEINRICKNNALVFSIMKLDNEDKKISDIETLYSKATWDRQASEFDMTCMVKNYYSKMFNLYIPGWEFMKKYNWKFLLYRINKKG